MRIAPTDVVERSNFNHLVMDIAWFGLALATTSRFLSVYAIRLGGTPADLGWLTAFPALILLISATFSGWWQQHFPNAIKALFLPGLGHRFVFLLPAAAPLLPPDWQPFWLILAASLPAIPQGVANVTFFVMMRETIPDGVMTRLLSVRSLAMNICVGVSALACGLWLEKAAFPINYQVMYAVAFLFALASLIHLTKLRVILPTPIAVRHELPFKAWRASSFRRVAFTAAVIHVAFFTIVPVTPIYLVKHHGAAEGFIALFGMIELAAGATMALLTPKIVAHIGNRAMIALAMGGTALAALTIALVPGLYFTLIGAAISGAAWTAATIGLFGYFMSSTASDQMTTHSAAYNQVIGLATFVGPLIGSTLAEGGMTLLYVMVIGAGCRLIAAPLVEYTLLSRFRHRLAVAHRHAL